MRKKAFNFLFIGLLASTTLFTSCKKDSTTTDDTNKLPTTFKVAIPTSLSRAYSTNKSTNDTLNGNEIYKHLNNFIHIGESAADLVQGIMAGISKNHINKAMDLTYTSSDDGRQKHLVVVENSTYENTAYQFQLTITDKSSENEADGGKALQVFWNTNPIKGTAIIKPYNCDRVQNLTYTTAMYRVDYSEVADANYDTQMTVYIAGLPLANPLTDPYSMSTLRMFVGRKGNYVDVRGNSTHPNAKFYGAQTTGFDWAFVASGNQSLNYAAAEVGLPSCILNSTDRNVLLKDYSIKNVLKAQILSANPGLDSNAVNLYLRNTTAPGYFNNGGFLQGGTSPGVEWTTLYNRTLPLTPFNPKEINDLVISFK